MTDGHTQRLESALAGRYKIQQKLGEGGMASVYLAEDVKHERNVALKILKPELAAVIGAERFLTEIKTTANLQHPHILPLFDSGESDGFLYYVMPYIDGETLQDRIQREGQLGVEEAVRIARDVADALDYAHRNDIIHRDIKPANILLHDGRPVVADFGIALAISAAGGGRMTETGLSLGTPHYMSPEQASADRDLSARSDVYSLGCVLYEMLAGQPPHTGPSAQSILVRILTEDPRDVTELRRTVPPHVAATVMKSIEKLPADRFDGARQFMDALEDSGFSHTVVTRTGTGATGAAAMPVPSTHARPWLRDPRSIAAVVAAVALGAFALFKPTPQPVPGVPTRARITEIDISRQWGGSRLAISPDGAWIVAGVVDAGTSHLHIRRADDPEWRRLANTENATNPVFSPDGQDVAFQRNADGIFRVPITGGPALPVAPGASFDPHWIGDDIVFMEGGQIRRVPATGGEAEVIFASDTVFAVRPHLLPNGKAVLFAEAVAGDPLASRVFLYEVETGELRVLAQSGNQPSYLPTGHVVFAHGSEALMAIPLDAETLEAGGAPMTLLPRLTVYNGGGAQYAVAQTGTLVYSATSGMGGSASRVLVEVDMEGTATTLPLVPAALQHPRYAPDGTKIAYEDGSEIRVYDVVTGASPQVTSGGGFYPEWAPSGAYIYFSSGGRAQADGTRRPSDLSEEAVSLFERPSGNYINDVAEGDSVLLVRENSTDRGMDLVIARLGPDSVVFEDYLTAEWNEWTPQISPDGRWVAYVSDEAGEARVFVHSFPTPTGQRAVSPGVGMHPVWSPDGDRIYYRDNERMWSVDVTYEPTFVVSAPTPLFEVGSFELNIASGRARAWDIHPDGDRFIFARARGVDGTQPGASDLLDEVYLVSNWFEEVRRLTGGSSR